jgi:hypothetical protein
MAGSESAEVTHNDQLNDEKKMHWMLTAPIRGSKKPAVRSDSSGALPSTG